jgi:hypothetical protein
MGHPSIGREIEPKSPLLPPFTCRRQASLLKSQTWATHYLAADEDIWLLSRTHSMERGEASLLRQANYICLKETHDVMLET